MCWFGGRPWRENRTRSQALVGWKIVSSLRGPLYYYGRGGVDYRAGSVHTMRPAIWSSPRTKFRVSRADNAGFHVYKSKREARLKLEVRNRRRAPLHHDRLIKVKIWGDMLVYPGKKAACANADRDGYGSPSGYRAEHMEVLT